MWEQLRRALVQENYNEDQGTLKPESRITCREHGCWNDAVHRERDHS